MRKNWRDIVLIIMAVIIVYLFVELFSIKGNMKPVQATGEQNYGVSVLNLDKPLNIAGNITAQGLFMENQSLPSVAPVNTGRISFSNNQFKVSENGGSWKSLLAKHRIYTQNLSYLQVTTDSSWHNSGVQRTITFPTDGVCIVNASWFGCCVTQNYVLTLGIFYDGNLQALISAQANIASYINEAVSCAISVTEGAHTISLYHSGAPGTFGVTIYQPNLLFFYIPVSQVEVYDKSGSIY